MSTLRSIHTFHDLLAYLGDELDWPVEDYALDELTFEYDADEIGLRGEDAAKIRGGLVRQLRPLHGSQPFGIFFIEFEKKRLPVVVLRRILSHLALKKRASANAAEAKRWAAADLIFVSAFGEAHTRQLAFAHFQQDPAGADLPVLRVLGWDGDDTPLKLDYVEHVLRDRLRWPADATDHAAWREHWRGAFRHRLGHIIRTSQALADALAALARRIRAAAEVLLAAESEKGPLTRLYKGFKDALIHDLTPEAFADTYAQTITYGLLTAAINRTDTAGSSEATYVKADDLTLMVRITSPFLREMLQTFLTVGGRKHGLDFDELGIQDVIDLLRGEETDLPAILRDFGNRTRGEDPVIHFYEHFLKAYNKKLKVQRGVFYTPQPAVSYIVRSVHELLQTEFGLEHGLADTTTWKDFLQQSKIKNPQSEIKLPPLTDAHNETRTISPEEPFVQILDPATGTATFLVEVIDLIHKHLQAKWKQRGLAAMPDLPAQAKIGELPKTFDAYWQLYVPHGLLPRLHGYELLAAPYAIAHLKLGLKLTETGYRFGSDERARVFLTNALEPWVKQLPLIGFDALAHEAAAVNEIKRHKRFTVVIGNPPYSNFGMLNKNPFILGLLEDYKRGLNEKKINLDDDFIKFMRFAQATLTTARAGTLGFITNNVYLDGMTHRRMRQSLLESFSSAWLLDLHGSTKKLETSQDSGKEENVFDIQQGVSIGLFARKPASTKTLAVHADFWGTRESKYRLLHSQNYATSAWNTIKPTSPHFFFVPKDFSCGAEYDAFYSLGDVFSVFQNGLKTDRDDLFFDFNRDDLEQRIRMFYSKKYDAKFVEQFSIHPSSSYDIEARRNQTLFAPTKIHQCLYRPFDFRWLYYDPNLTSRPASKVMRHQLAGHNLALVCLRQTRRNEEGTFFVCRHLINKDAVSLFDIGTVFPLFLYEEKITHDNGQKEIGFAQAQSKRPNFGNNFLKIIETALRLPKDDAHFLPVGLTPEDIFHYIYAVFHSPGYRTRYAEFLKIDFPRVPLPGSLDLFRDLAKLGGELVALHLLESPLLDTPRTEFVGANGVVSKVTYTPDHGGTVWIDGGGTKKAPKPGSSGFRPVPENVWNFHIGGYQVCEKWLKDRKGRTLSTDDIAHYHKIVIALTETIRLMAEIDEVIGSHGGWPGAFHSPKESTSP
jgi:hypothetical protein